MFRKPNAFGADPKLSPANSGYFGYLPPELFCLLLSRLPLLDISNLALTSNSLRIFIADWVSNSKGALERVPELPEQQEEGGGLEKALKHLCQAGQPAYHFAILCKRLTYLLGTRDRIKFGFKIFHRVLLYQSERPLARHRSKDWNTTLYIAQYCGMIHVFSRGWDESEYGSLITALDARFDIGKKLAHLLAQPHRDDVCVESEMRIRLLLRSLTWDFAGKDYRHKAVSRSVVRQEAGEINK